MHLVIYVCVENMCLLLQTMHKNKFVVASVRCDEDQETISEE